MAKSTFLQDVALILVAIVGVIVPSLLLFTFGGPPPLLLLLAVGVLLSFGMAYRKWQRDRAAQRPIDHLPTPPAARLCVGCGSSDVAFALAGRLYCESCGNDPSVVQRVQDVQTSEPARTARREEPVLELNLRAVSPSRLTESGPTTGATRLPIDSGGTDPLPARGMSPRFVSIMIVLVAIGSIVLLAWHRRYVVHHHFTLPGWDDLVTGEPPPRDVELACDKANETSDCHAIRGIAAIREVLVTRRPDSLGVLRVMAVGIDPSVLTTIKSQWGTPRLPATRGQGELWCSPDGKEAATITEPYSVTSGGDVFITDDPSTWPVDECAKVLDTSALPRVPTKPCPDRATAVPMLSHALGVAPSLFVEKMYCVPGHFPDPGWAFVVWTGKRADNPYANGGAFDDGRAAHLHHVVVREDGELIADAVREATWHERNDDAEDETLDLRAIDLDGDGLDELVEATEASSPRTGINGYLNVLRIQSRTIEVAGGISTSGSSPGGDDWSCKSEWSIDASSSPPTIVIGPTQYRGPANVSHNPHAPNNCPQHEGRYSFTTGVLRDGSGNTIAGGDPYLVAL